MSSSAAFEVLIGNILSGLYNDMKIDPVFWRRPDSMQRMYTLENHVD